MKKIVLCALLCIMSTTMFAQSSDGSYWCYCRIHGDIGLDSDIKYYIEFNDSKEGYLLCDKNNDEIIANSIMHMVNILSKNGWEYVDMIPINKVNYYVMKKKVKSDDEAFANYKLLSPEEFKKNKKDKEKNVIR